MGKITREETLKIARLARLTLEGPAVDGAVKHLESILEYVEQLQELDVTGVPPTSHVLHLSNVMRDDIAEPRGDTEPHLENAPSRDGYFFKVPKVLGA